VVDTITAPARAISVVVRGTNGAPAARAPVRFETVTLDESVRRGPWGVLCAEGTAVCGTVGATSVAGLTTVVDTTDAQGRATAVVRLGTFAGTSYLRITAPEQGLADSVALDVRPGAAARINFAARDTALAIGVRSTTEAFAADRFFNPLNDVVQVGGACGSVADFDTPTRTITARAFGVCYVRALVGNVVDSARVLVLPPGRLLTWSTQPLLQLVDTDGRNPRTLFSGSSFRSDLGVFPGFSRSRAAVTLHFAPTQAGPAQLIARGDTAERGASTLGTILTNPAYPRELADGSILVVARTASTGDSYAVWRMNASGAAMLVRPLVDYAGTYGSVDISPDGSRVVYVGGVIGGANQLRILDLATGVVTNLNVPGEAPRWSPAGDQIAFIHGVRAQNVRGGLSVLRLSDALPRVVTQRELLPGFAWSPDGAYIVAGTDAGPVIIRVADGVTVPTRILSSPNAREFDWR